MTDKQRIVKLEERIAQLEGRLAMAEARWPVYVWHQTYPPLTPSPYTPYYRWQSTTNLPMTTSSSVSA